MRKISIFMFSFIHVANLSLSAKLGKNDSLKTLKNIYKFLNTRKKYSSLNFTELFKNNFGCRYFGNEVKENVQNFS